jgi:hypothetical protein
MTTLRPTRAVRADAAAAGTAPDDFSYDAFISYSGFRKTGEASDFDRKVAERLHRSLETYRVPRALLKKPSGHAHLPRRLTKIFRDRDEVRVSGSLHDSMAEALRRSRFLIVICSPRARQSQWINQEIAIFRGLGKGEQILPLLIEGEPAEAFPAELFKVKPKSMALAHTSGARDEWLAQPLAADIRAPSVSKSLRLLRHEKLRLLAAMLGCEYDDLRQREHERFVRRATSVGAAMLTLLLVLTALSILLFFAQQRASRNAELALSAGAAILPLVALEEPSAPLGANDPVSREVYVTNAIDFLETLRKDDPENLKCLTTLRALYGTRAALLTARNREADARAAYQQADSLTIPIALSRLRSWRPTEDGRDAARSGEVFRFPNDYDRNRLRALLDIMEQLQGAANSKQAVEYCEVAAEYVLLLDTSTGEGRAEVRRVLQTSLNKLQQAHSLEPLVPPQRDLVEAINGILNQLPRNA